MRLFCRDKRSESKSRLAGEMQKRLKSPVAPEIGILAAVILLTAVAVTPLLRTAPPCTHDGGLHYFRIVAMRRGLANGLLISRWVPDLAFGYGYPFFNYRAASSYYLGLALHVAGLSLPLALNMVYVLSLLASALGAYLLGRDLFGRQAGVVAAVAYVYAPYPLIDALVRGNMPESVALALFPFILWAFRRLLLSGQARYLLLSAGTLALLFLSHNISSLLFTPFLALYLGVVWLARGRRDHLIQAGLGLALGMGLTAFFWAPAVLEMDEVQLHMSRTTRNNDFHYNFVNLEEVLAPPEAADPALLNPPLKVPLGLPLAILAGLGTFVALWRWRKSLRRDNAPPNPAQMAARERWWTVVFLALSTVVLIFMATEASVRLWEALPLISFVQFPWRFVGRAVLPASLLAGALVSALPTVKDPWTGRSWILSRWATWASVLVMILSALPFTYPPTGYCPTKAQPHILDLFAYEHRSGLVGVDPEGSYFPATVQRRPDGSPLETQYEAEFSRGMGSEDTVIARLDTTSLPEDAVVHQEAYAPNRAWFEIETPQATRVRYLTFAFPGWQVYVDGRSVPVTPSDSDGLITFELPAGRHDVAVIWGSTPIRAAATGVSLVALTALVFAAYVALRNHLTRRIRGEAPTSAVLFHPVPDRTSPRQVVTLAALGVALLVLKVGLVDRSETPFRRSGLTAQGALPSVEVSVEARFEDGIRLLGYERSTSRMPADGTLHLAFYWSAYERPSREYQATVALVGPDGQLWSSKTAFPRRGYGKLPPSPAWWGGRYAIDGLDVEPLPGTPPGRYDLQLTIFDRETLAPLNVLGPDGQVRGPNLVVGQIDLTRPTHPPDPEQVTMQVRINADQGPLALAGADLDRAEATPGDPMLVTLFWHAPTQEWPAQPAARPDLQTRLALACQEGACQGADADDGPAATWDLPPVRADWPTPRWQPGDLWRGQHLFRLPGRLDSGRYTWQLHLYESGGGSAALEPAPATASVTLGELWLDAPARRWQAPALQITSGAQLGGRATLLGANLQPAEALAGGMTPPATLTTTLAWQAETEMNTSYRVFLHLLGPQGELLTQSDGEPSNWTRPTVGWAPGEVVLDRRILEIPASTPPGSYTLVAGLYDPATRQRLPRPNGTDAVPLGTLTIKAP
jgi:hypothetical protein